MVYLAWLATLLVGLDAPHATYWSICDASAAVAIDERHFLVADDESERLLLYRNEPERQDPIGSGIDLSDRLRDEPDRECDIEGAARAGDRVYWITSHARNRKGKLRGNRYRLFAIGLRGDAEDLSFDWVGRYDRLLHDALSRKSWTEPDAANVRRVIALLETSTQLSRKRRPELSPGHSGLNLESLAALPDGTLLLGLRNPRLDEQAVVLHLLNPDELLSGKPGGARFGAPRLLALGGLGICSMDYVESLQSIVLIACPTRSVPPVRLFRWDGTTEGQPTLIHEVEAIENSIPEALVTYPERKELHLLHDHGSMNVDGRLCKHAPPAERSFRDSWYPLEDSGKTEGDESPD